MAIYTVKNSREANPKTVGSKAWTLLLLKEHFNIPEFLVVSTEDFRDYQINKQISFELQRDLVKTLEYFLRKGPVVIRSSGTAEDLPGLSFAGMYTTVLDVATVEDGIRAIMRVWDSMNSLRVKIYCRKMNVPLGEMAVIIQHQLKPETSGVMITQSPFAVNEILIECCEGLGEKLVSGKITPTRYRVKNNKVIEQKGENLLSQKQLDDLTDAGKRIEKIFKSPQDIEWSIENSKLFILQSRPVLVHGSTPRRKCTVWCNVNVRETIPDPVSPLMWSLFDDFLFPLIILDVFGFPLSISEYRKYPGVENLSGRLYWNMNNTMAYGKTVAPLLNLLESNKNLDPQMAIAFKSVDLKSLPSLMPFLKNLSFSIVALIRLTNFLFKSFFFHRSFRKKYILFNKKFEEKISSFMIADSLKEALKNIENWMAIKVFARHYFGGIFLSLFYLILLQRLFSLRLGKKGEAMARKSITGLMDKTGEMAMALDCLSILAHKKLGKVTFESLKDLYKSDQEFKNKFDAFIDEFGHRGPAEFEIASTTFREDHELVFRMLIAPREMRDYSFIHKQAIKDLMDMLRPIERTILKIFLPRLEAYVPLRENGKHYYFKQMAKIKDQFFVIDKLLRDQGFLKQEQDIFFLSWNDLKVINDKKITQREVLGLVETRKKEWELYRKVHVPDIIYESGERVTGTITPGIILSGEPLSFGIVKARACVVKEFKESSKLKKGEILVTHHTDPAWTPLFTIASGVIIEVGGLVCHAAMVAREMGIPAVVVKGATDIIPDGAAIELDADLGKAIIIENSSQ